MKAQISTSGIGVGEVKYAGPEFGPFDCGHCAWFSFTKSGGQCQHPEVVADKALAKNSQGLAIVDQHGCCNEFRPTRKLDEIKFSDAGI